MYQSQEISLVSGDRLHLFSDGIYEVLSPEGEMWGCQGLEESCQQVSKEPLRNALKQVICQSKDWQQLNTFGDDVALVGVEIG